VPHDVVRRDAVFFVVERHPLGEQAALFYKRLPTRYTGKNAARDGLVYALRLDTLPDAARWLGLPISRLHNTYRRLRDSNTLPAGNLT
jgi:hypothetical protein